MAKGKKKSSVTPSRQQYLDVKAAHQDAILFFHLGDFYEMFDQDAEIVARELDLVLTSRPVKKGIRIPMAGVPRHAAENYIARLIAKGYKVALCEQIGSTPVNGLMPREVTRIFTAGTLIEPGMLDAGRNNYLVSLIVEGTRAGLAYADISTGEFATTQLNNFRQLHEELARLSPVELILPEEATEFRDAAPTISTLPRWRFEEGNARLTLQNHFHVSTLSAFGCEQKPLAISAAGAILHYLLDTQKGAISQIQRLSTYATSGYMALDHATRRNLELIESLSGERKSSLLAILNKTITPMGARLLRQRVTRPLLELNPLNERLDEVESLFNNAILRTDLRTTLKGMPDLERLTNRVLSQRATPRDLEHIEQALSIIPLLQKKQSTTTAPPIEKLITQLNPCTNTASLIKQALHPDAPTNTNKPGFIRPGFSPELDAILNSSASARDWVANLESRERTRTGISNLKVGFNKVFGYYIEISRGNAAKAPDDYIRKQTLTNAERFITPELKEYETLILNAEERMLEVERRLFIELTQEIASASDQMLATSYILAQIDVAANLAELASNRGYIRPILDLSNTLHIENGRHPVIEETQKRNQFVPNDSHFDDQGRIHLITGPNMSGKSTYLRQTALITLMAQIGSFVPAHKAEIGLVDRIFTRIGAHDELHAGRSTFMVEMVETAEILNHATHQSLLILDEIGRGTSTYDGLSLAWAIVEYLHNHPRLKPRTLFATHYHELTGLADLLPLVDNYNVAVTEQGDQIIFLHQIIQGSTDRSYGIHVAQLAGIPKDVIHRANEILLELEAHAPTTTITPSHLKPAQQIALFPEASPILDELGKLDVTSMTPLDAINKLYEWQKKFTR